MKMQREKKVMTKYTPLVKSMHKDLKKKGFNLSLEKTYQKLLKANFIDADGQPTKWAIENGYVGVEYTYSQGMQANQDQADIMEVLNRLPQSAIHFNDSPDLSKIENAPLKKAIKDALKDDALSAKGRKAWKYVLADIEMREKQS